MSIKIDRIIVKNMFGKFNYDLKLDNGYDVSILIAPNGCGKTTIFNILNFIFCPGPEGFEIIRNVPFDEFTCTLSNKAILKLKQENGEIVFIIIPDSSNISINEIKLGFETTYFLGYSLQNNKMPSYDEFMEIKYKEYDGKSNHSNESVKNNYFRNRNNYFYWMHFFKDANSYDQFTKPIDNFKNYLKSVADNLFVNYIPANRLFFVNKDGEASDSLDKINNEIKNSFGLINETYRDNLLSAKDKIFEVFLGPDFEEGDYYKEIEASYDNVVKAVNEYIQKVINYNDLNLIEASDVINKSFKNIVDRICNDFNKMPGSCNESFDKSTLLKLSFINLYIKLFSETLGTFEDFYNRLKLFFEILNRRNKITEKEFVFSKCDGIKFKVNDSFLSLKLLSSGEKNDLVMLYNLIFRSNNGGLVLIDEPEISLHIEWQETIIDTMLEICKMNGLQAIIATHSPHILNGRFDLLLEGGPTK